MITKEHIALRIQHAEKRKRTRKFTEHWLDQFIALAGIVPEGTVITHNPAGPGHKPSSYRGRMESTVLTLTPGGDVVARRAEVVGKWVFKVLLPDSSVDPGTALPTEFGGVTWEWRSGGGNTYYGY